MSSDHASVLVERLIPTYEGATCAWILEDNHIAKWWVINACKGEQSETLRLVAERRRIECFFLRKPKEEEEEEGFDRV